MYILLYFNNYFINVRQVVVFLETQVELFLYKKSSFVSPTYTRSDNIHQMDNMNYTEAFTSIKTSDVIQYDAITVP